MAAPTDGDGDRLQDIIDDVYKEYKTTGKVGKKPSPSQHVSYSKSNHSDLSNDHDDAISSSSEGVEIPDLTFKPLRGFKNFKVNISVASGIDSKDVAISQEFVVSDINTLQKIKNIVLSDFMNELKLFKSPTTLKLLTYRLRNPKRPITSEEDEWDIISTQAGLKTWLDKVEQEWRNGSNAPARIQVCLVEEAEGTEAGLPDMWTRSEARQILENILGQPPAQPAGRRRSGRRRHTRSGKEPSPPPAARSAQVGRRASRRHQPTTAAAAAPAPITYEPDWTTDPVASAAAVLASMPTAPSVQWRQEHARPRQPPTTVRADTATNLTRLFTPLEIGTLLEQLAQAELDAEKAETAAEQSEKKSVALQAQLANVQFELDFYKRMVNEGKLVWVARDEEEGEDEDDEDNDDTNNGEGEEE